MTPDKIKLVAHMLIELQSPSKPLSNWEENFVESVQGQFEERGSVSTKQFEILEKLYAEKTA
jgi:hypothetical protein